MMDMVEESGPKTAGKKPSSRKRSNAKRKRIEQYVDLFDQNERNSTLRRPTIDTSTFQQGYVPAQLPMASSSSIPEMQPSRSYSHQCRLKLIVYVGHTGPGDCLQKRLHALFHQWRDFHRFHPPLEQKIASPHIPPANLYVSAPFQFSPAFEYPTNPYVN